MIQEFNNDHTSAFITLLFLIVLLAYVIYVDNHKQPVLPFTVKDARNSPAQRSVFHRRSSSLNKLDVTMV